jgi:hypothetical protein
MGQKKFYKVDPRSVVELTLTTFSTDLNKTCFKQGSNKHLTNF